MVAEEGQNADAEHGRHKKKKQDMEFGVSAVQLILERRQGGGEEVSTANSFYSNERRRGAARGGNRVTACTPGCCKKALDGGWGYLWTVLCRFPPAKL